LYILLLLICKQLFPNHSSCSPYWSNLLLYSVMDKLHDLRTVTAATR
jgi:hypothetical protein